MADHHDARDGSRRTTYRHLLGRPLSAGNAGAMQWGEPYRELHRRAWGEVRRVLVPDGLFILNAKDHVRGGAPVPVVGWHLETLAGLGFEEVERHEVPTPGNRYGANRSARVAHEVVAVLRRQGVG